MTRIATKYDSEFHPDDLAYRRSKGEIDCEIFSAWDISKNCFYKWIRDHAEMKESHERSKEKWEAAWVKKCVKFMEEGNDKAYRYWNKVMSIKAEGWADHKAGSDSQTNININNMQIVNQGTKTELIDYLMEELTSLNIIEPPKEVLLIENTANESYLPGEFE